MIAWFSLIRLTDALNIEYVEGICQVKIVGRSLRYPLPLGRGYLLEVKLLRLFHVKEFNGRIPFEDARKWHKRFACPSLRVGLVLEDGLPADLPDVLTFDGPFDNEPTEGEFPIIVTYNFDKVREGTTEILYNDFKWASAYDKTLESLYKYRRTEKCHPVLKSFFENPKHGQSELTSLEHAILVSASSRTLSEIKNNVYALLVSFETVERNPHLITQAVKTLTEEGYLEEFC